MSIMFRARAGPSEEVKRAAKAEGADPEWIRRMLATGRAVIPCNPIHSPEPCAIGEGLTVKVNANVGTSRDLPDLEPELEKARVAVRYGADAIMDLSTGGDVDAIRRTILKEVRVPVGTVPIYQEGLRAARRSAVVDMDEDDMFGGIERHAKDGVDFMTVHCGITLESVSRLRNSGRLTDVVSRGGSFLTAWILHNEMENPLYENFDYLLELAQKYEFALSLGDGLRPGCVDNAPFYVLGPLVTDIAPGYDHIVGAIGGAIAAFAGADFLCYVTPAEHLSLPDVEDVKEGVIASKIAAHAADLALGRGAERDERMARARKRLDWEAMYREALDPEKARRYRKRGATAEDEGCSMCGDVCAIKLVQKYLEE
jgi:phosphomethylpyrimidine synthase